MFSSANVAHFLSHTFDADAWQVVAGSQLRVMGQLWAVDMQFLGLWCGEQINLILNM